MVKTDLEGRKPVLPWLSRRRFMAVAGGASAFAMGASLVGCKKNEPTPTPEPMHFVLHFC